MTTKVWVIRGEVEMVEYDGQATTRYLARSTFTRFRHERARHQPVWTWAPTPLVYVFARRSRALQVIKQLEAKTAWPLEAAEQDLDAWTAACLLTTSRVD